MASIPVITPWKDLDELLTVRDLLYPKQSSGDEEYARRKLLAVRIVYTWEKRGRLPHAVLSTAQLTEAVVAAEQLSRQDVSDSRQQLAMASPSALRSVLAMAVSQFVTGFCDAPASRATVRRSMYEVASDIGMPQSWVEVRHEITHGKMPELNILNACAEEAIEWLWKHYWASLDKKVDLSEINSEAIRELVLKLLPAKMEEVKTKKTGTVDEIIANIITSSSRGDVKTLASIFIQENLLMPKRKITEDNMKAAFRFWDSSIQEIASQRSDFYRCLLLEFQEALLKQSSLDPDTDTNKMAVYMWMEHMLVSPPWLQYSFVDSEQLYEEVIDACLLSPSLWTHKLAKLLLDNGTDEFRRDWERQYLASTGFLNHIEPTSKDEVMHDSDDENTQNGGWKPYKGVWTPRPIGQL